MKIRLKAKEVIYHDIEIDTDGYDVNENDPFDLAEFINEIKDDPSTFVETHSDSNGLENLEISKVKQ